MNRHLKRALELAFVPIAAAIIFFEQTLIRWLNVMTAAFARWTPIARLEAWLVTLPPWGALLTFVAPSILILPMKLMALLFVAHGRYAMALTVLILGKVLATAILARLYRILRPTLMRIRWFAWADTKFFYWRDKAYAFVKSLPAWQQGRELVLRVRTYLTGLVAGWFAR